MMYTSYSLKFIFNVVLVCVAIASASNFLAAQEVRYQLGKQVIAFESDFEQGYHDLATRKRVIPSLQSAVQSFFQLSLSDAGKFIDTARLELTPLKDKNFARDLISLRLTPNSRWFDTSGADIAWSLKKSYETNESASTPVRIRLTFKNDPLVGLNPILSLEQPIESFPIEFQQTIKENERVEGDFRVEATIIGEKNQFQMPWQMISFSKNRDDRLASAAGQLKGIPKEPRSVLRQTLELNLKLLRDLSRGRVQETDYPAHGILIQSEKWLKQAQLNESVIDISRAGQYWLDYSKVGKSGIVRIQVPTDADPAKPFKVLVAYHGAGGSENMFFDSYGAGRIATLAQDAGYVLIAPRQPLISGIVSLQELLDSISKSLPIDRQRIDLIGHSMGAGQLIQQVEQNPGIARSCVVLGGGRAIAKPTAWANVRVFAAAGDVDFGKRGVLAFAESMKQTTAVVEDRIYENVEHLAIVQVALTDIFDWFKGFDK